MRGVRGTWGMFTRIPGNVFFLILRGMFKKIPRNAQEDSGESWKRFRGMLKKILGNVEKDSGECSKKFRGMFKEILGNFVKSCEILLIFCQILQLNWGKEREYFLCYYLLFITNLLCLNTIFLPPFSLFFLFLCWGKGAVTGV